VTARTAALLAAVAFLIAGCSPPHQPPSPVSVRPVDMTPAGAHVISATPTTSETDCDREASLLPGPLPPSGAMPTGSTMASIAERGRLVVGVDQNTYLFGYRNPDTGVVEGFDVDIAREIARAIFGDPGRVDLRVVDAEQRESALATGQVDLIVRTYSVTCERKKTVDFSTVYYYASQRILTVKGSGIHSATDLGDKRVCAVYGTTSLPRLLALKPAPEVIGAYNWTDCMLMLQQGQIDAISTDDAVLSGLAKQDPNVEIVGPSMGTEPYGIGISKGHEDLVRFVNGVLDRLRADGTWEHLYDKWLLSLAPSPGPPPARYQGQP
jgi:polar amino acid transport system substrate-binding protein